MRCGGVSIMTPMGVSLSKETATTQVALYARNNPVPNRDPTIVKNNGRIRIRPLVDARKAPELSGAHPDFQTEAKTTAAQARSGTIAVVPVVSDVDRLKVAGAAD
jgi:hypothetical protein